MMDFQTSPYLLQNVSVRRIMLYVLAALLPGITAYVWQIGPAILVQMTLATLTALASEALMLRLRGGQKSGTKLKIENILRAKDKKNIGKVLKSENGAERAFPFEALPAHIKKAYEALSVKAGADESEIRSAYRKKLKLFHPDSNSENETVQRVAHKKTEEIVEAYKAILAYKNSIG